MSSFSPFAAATFQLQALNSGAVAVSYHEQADGFSDGITLSASALELITDD